MPMTLRVAAWNDTGTEGGLTFAVEAERLGVHSLWSPEAWGFDAVTPLAYSAARTSSIRLGTAIAQVGARTPALLAMTSLSMQALTRGRFILGLGTSGPQVIEGWHGVPFTTPLRRTRETIEIVRMAARGEKVTYHGRIYDLPLPGGEGRAIRTSAPPADVPIYIASLGPANLRLTGELADGWLGTAFVPESAAAFLEPMREGAAAVGRTMADLDLAVAATVEFTDDVDEAAQRHAAGYAFTFGAMGSEEHNFYNDAFSRQGFGDDVRAVQQLWLAGKRDEARRRVPVEIALKTNLLGPPAMVLERLRAYRDAGVTTIRTGLPGATMADRLDALAQLIDLVGEVNAEPASVTPGA